MSREAKVIAVAGGLNPKGLDLTKYRQRWIGDKRPNLRADEAGGALGFAAGPVKIEDEWYAGDEFRVLLLRMKEGRQLSADPFKRALLLLLKRHGTPDPSVTEEAVAAGALFEWLNNDCFKCRGAKAGKSRPSICPECFPPAPLDKAKPAGRRELMEIVSSTARHVVARFAAVPTAKKGCRRCGGGLGRIFRPDLKRRAAFRCRECGNSGRIEFDVSNRWRFVNDYLRVKSEARGEIAAGINRKTFLKNWMTRYEKFLKALQGHERKLGVGLDLGLNASKMSRTESVPDGD
jgi:hypothetical protein